MAEPSIQAGGWGAVINVDITVCPRPSRSTVTLVAIHHILEQTCTHMRYLQNLIRNCNDNTPNTSIS